MSPPTKDWLTVSEVAEIEGVSTETIRRGIKAFKYPASRASAAPGAPWLINAAAYERRRESEARKRRLRERRVVTAYADDEFDANVESVHGATGLEQVRQMRQRHEDLREAQRAVSNDPDLRRAFEQLDEDERIERAAQEIANRVRRDERIRQRAAQILEADDDEHHA